MKLTNATLDIQIDRPFENYNFSRFDWSGKISDVRYKGTSLFVAEHIKSQHKNDIGRGLYNEFGIDSGLGFEDAEVGGWFHKIGVGLLRKDSDQYGFSKRYEIKPAEFESSATRNTVTLTSRSQAYNGYAYYLIKVIELFDSSFAIRYRIENTGDKDIVTDEYTHNFIGIDRTPIGPDYKLRLPFRADPDHCEKVVNPESKVILSGNQVTLNGVPEEQFFFSDLSGSTRVPAKWELINLNKKLGISEEGDFETDKVNLWGWSHVISPELFQKINIRPGQSTEWSRIYSVYNID